MLRKTSSTENILYFNTSDPCTTGIVFICASFENYIVHQSSWISVNTGKYAMLLLRLEIQFPCDCSLLILRVERGVRQGSITSPWMFNLVYQELVQRVNEMNCGISIGDKRFNIFCYADDILLASTTITGLQVMADVCTDYVEAHGLNFNASKTNWTIKVFPCVGFLLCGGITHIVNKST